MAMWIKRIAGLCTRAHLNCIAMRAVLNLGIHGTVLPRERAMKVKFEDSAAADAAWELRQDRGEVLHDDLRFVFARRIWQVLATIGDRRKSMAYPAAGGSASGGTAI